MKDNIKNQKEIILVMQGLLCPLPNSDLEQTMRDEIEKNTEWLERKTSLQNTSRRPSSDTRSWYQAFKEEFS